MTNMCGGGLMCVVIVVCCGAGCCVATSPWRLPHGLGDAQLQNALQIPTFRPKTTVRTEPPLISTTSNQGHGAPSTETPQNKSYKTFYRVFYGTHPTPDLERRTPQKSFQTQPRSLESSQELDDVRSANEHFLQVRTHFRCGVPRPRVYRVHQIHPDPAKEYLPRCAVLHRCGDDTGCCENDDFQCVPRAIQEVALTFYVLSVSSTASNGISNSIEKLMFQNHTECECQMIHELPRSGGYSSLTTETSTASTTTPTTTRASPSTSTATTTTTTTTEAIRPNRESTWRWSKCRECPVPFHRREYQDGRCSCDCFDRHKPCLKVKRGRDPLTEVERRCVEAAHCHIPECEYGDYDYDTGMCPKKPDNYRKPAEGRGYGNSAHRWNYLERD